MTHNKKIDVLLARYRDPELTETQRNQIDQLVQTDPEAGKILAQYQRLDDLLARLPNLTECVDFDRFSSDVSRSVRNTAIESRRIFLRLPSLPSWRITIPAAVAAAAMAALLAWAVLMNRGPVQRTETKIALNSAPANFVRLYGNPQAQESRSGEKIVNAVQVCLNQGSGGLQGDKLPAPSEVIYFVAPRSESPTGAVEDSSSAYF
jgi:hypothetical protein